jgi:hypothetical protein
MANQYADGKSQMAGGVGILVTAALVETWIHLNKGPVAMTDIRQLSAHRQWLSEVASSWRYTAGEEMRLEMKWPSPMTDAWSLDSGIWSGAATAADPAPAESKIDEGPHLPTEPAIAVEEPAAENVPNEDESSCSSEGDLMPPAGIDSLK